HPHTPRCSARRCRRANSALTCSISALEHRSRTFITIVANGRSNLSRLRTYHAQTVEIARASARSRSAPSTGFPRNMPTERLASGPCRMLSCSAMTKPVPGFDIGAPSTAKCKRPYAGTPGFDISDDTATPNSISNPIRALRENSELVQDLCRYAENLASESAVRRKWRLDEETWELLGADDELVRAIEEEKTRRIRSGATKRELAQAAIVRGPGVLASIMDDSRQNSRHRIDSVRALNAIADPGPEAVAGEEKVYIRID